MFWSKALTLVVLIQCDVKRPAKIRIVCMSEKKARRKRKLWRLGDKPRCYLTKKKKTDTLIFSQSNIPKGMGVIRCFWANLRQAIRFLLFHSSHIGTVFFCPAFFNGRSMNTNLIWEFFSDFRDESFICFWKNFERTATSRKIHCLDYKCPLLGDDGSQSGPL